MKNNLKLFIKLFFIKFAALLFAFVIFQEAAKANSDDINLKKQNEHAKITVVIGSYDVPANNSSAGSIANIGVKFKLDNGWHIYWRSPGSTGMPTSFDLTRSENLKDVQISYPYPKLKIEDLPGQGKLYSYIYQDEVLFPVALTSVDENQDIKVNLDVNYAICAEICVPGSANFAFSVSPKYKDTASDAAILEARKLIPTIIDNKAVGTILTPKNPKIIADIATIKPKFLSIDFIPVAGASNLQVAAYKQSKFFLETPADAEFGAIKSEIIDNKIHLLAEVKSAFAASDLAKKNITITMVLPDNTAYEFTINSSAIEITNEESRKLESIETQITNDDEKETIKDTVSGVVDETIGGNLNLSSKNRLLLMVLFAFLGGLILNIMPCVLPIISIKLFSVLKHSGGNSSVIRANFLFTALGILTLFLCFTVFTIYLKTIGQIVGWGLHFQNPYFIVCLVLIMIFFAANMWGGFEIGLPGSLSGWINKRNGGYDHEHSTFLGPFSTGFTAALLATPCSAPFVGVAVSFALSQDNYTILAIFLSMATGFAMPYLALSFFPGLLSFLPKPGAWLITFKKIMSTVLLLSAGWFIWIFYTQVNFGAAISLLLLVSLLWLYLVFGRRSRYFNYGFWVHLYALFMFIIWSLALPVWFKNDSGDSVSSIPKDSFWGEFREDNIKNLVDDGNIVFVDITASWCLTCKINKTLVLDTDEVRAFLKQNKVIAMQGDMTKPNAQIFDYIKAHGRSGIPFNIIYGPKAKDGILLPEIFTKDDLFKAVKAVN